MNANRMNPYSAGPPNSYRRYNPLLKTCNFEQLLIVDTPQPPAYTGYNAGPLPLNGSVPPPTGAKAVGVSNGSVATGGSANSKYRR